MSNVRWLQKISALLWDVCVINTRVCFSWWSQSCVIDFFISYILKNQACLHQLDHSHYAKLVKLLGDVSTPPAKLHISCLLFWGKKHPERVNKLADQVKFVHISDVSVNFLKPKGAQSAFPTWNWNT